MKDWEWFALGLVPFAGMPVALARYFLEDHTPSPGQLAASAVGGQAVAWGIQRAGLYKMNEALMLYRLSQFGFVEEGAGRTGYSLVRGKKVSGVRNIRGSGVGFRPTLAMRVATPILIAFMIGGIANAISGPYVHGDRYRAHRGQYQPDFDEYI